jgi:hypothetical protein
MGRYFMIANALAYCNEKTDERPLAYYLRAAKILENILLEKYEKAGIEVVIDPSLVIKPNLVIRRPNDDEGITDVKSVLADLYEKVASA